MAVAVFQRGRISMKHTGVLVCTNCGNIIPEEKAGENGEKEIECSHCRFLNSWEEVFVG